MARTTVVPRKAAGLLPDGTAVASSQGNVVYPIAPNGAKRWAFRAGDDVESARAVAEDGTVYVGLDEGRLYALAPTGTVAAGFQHRRDIRASPAVAPGEAQGYGDR